MKGFALDLTVSGDLPAIRAEVVRKKSGAARPRTQACHPCPIPCLLLSLGSLFYSHRQRAGGSRSLRKGATNTPRISEMDSKVLA